MPRFSKVLTGFLAVLANAGYCGQSKGNVCIHSFVNEVALQK